MVKDVLTKNPHRDTLDVNGHWHQHCIGSTIVDERRVTSQNGHCGDGPHIKGDTAHAKKCGATNRRGGGITDHELMAAASISAGDRRRGQGS